MLALVKRRKKTFIFLGLLAGAIVGVYFGLFYRTPDIRKSMPLRETWMHTRNLDPSTNDEMVLQALAIAREYPGTKGALLSLQMASARVTDPQVRQQIKVEYASQIQTCNLNHLATSLDWGIPKWENMTDVAPMLLERAKTSFEHPKCGRLLSTVCVITRPREGSTAPALYQEAADLIRTKCPESEDLNHFCHGLAHADDGTNRWAENFEPHLKTILEKNTHRKVRASAKFALATIVQHSIEDRQEEAIKHFEEYLAEFDDNKKHDYMHIEQIYTTNAQNELAELRSHAVGHPATDVSGVDLDNKPLALKDLRGKVVLLNFWGSWCFPCLKMVPHEKELAKEHEGKPFEIVGVNCDDELENAKQAAEKTKMTWRSLQNALPNGSKITKDWKVGGFPTLYLIDHHGIIRKRWVGNPSPEEFKKITAILVDAAEKKFSVEQMANVKTAIRDAQIPLKSPIENLDPKAPAPFEKNFQQKVYKAPDGKEYKYAVHVPSNYDGQTPLPAILYLHGAGPRGSDGLAQLQYGLPKHLRNRKTELPVIAIFPQAAEGENWTANSPSAKRAMEILKAVEAEYKVDPNRVYLSGMSMGAQGTWSLAGAYPDRWAAILPIAHGGDTSDGPKIKNIPCWCFHGDADRTIRPQQSRDMIQAIADAGGKPLFNLLPGVDHNSCPDHVFAMPEVFEWLLLQSKRN